MNRFSYSIFLTAITLLVSPSISLSAECEEEGLTGFMRGLGLTWGADFDKGVTAYENGDYESALCHWIPLAEQGDADAQFGLGEIYNAKMVRPGATLGDNLSIFDFEWRGVDLAENIFYDYEAAVKWYTLAAEQGHAKAQFDLGILYNIGKGVPQDLVYAYVWFNLAASSGDEDAKKSRDQIAKEMFREDLSLAQKLARECFKKDFKGC